MPSQHRMMDARADELIMKSTNSQQPLKRGFSRVTTSPEETLDLAAAFLTAFPLAHVLALHGDLGAGKTCFVRGLASAMGIREAITSPTFTLVREYAGTRRLVHIDLYRIASPDELLVIGFEDYLDSDALVVIEWAERAGDLLPLDALHLTFRVEPGEERRRITLS